MPFKTTLEAALAHLKSKGIIENDYDVLPNTGITSRGTLSSYVTGGARISKNFRTKFENYYNLRLDDFSHLLKTEDEEPERLEESQIEPAQNIEEEGAEIDYKSKYMALLEEHLEIKKALLQELQEIKAFRKDIDVFRKSHETMKEDLNGLLHTQQVAAAIQLSFQEYWLEHFVADKDNRLSVQKKIKQRAFDSLLKIEKEGIDVGSGIVDNDHS